MILIFVKLCCNFFLENVWKNFWKKHLGSLPCPIWCKWFKTYQSLRYKSSTPISQVLSLTIFQSLSVNESGIGVIQLNLHSFQFKRHTSPILTHCQQELTSATFYCLSTRINQCHLLLSQYHKVSTIIAALFRQCKQGAWVVFRYVGIKSFASSPRN